MGEKLSHSAALLFQSARIILHSGSGLRQEEIMRANRVGTFQGNNRLANIHALREYLRSFMRVLKLKSGPPLPASLYAGFDL